MTHQQKQLRTQYEKYAFAKVERAEGGGYAIRIITTHRGKTPVYGHVCYASGSVYKWDNEAEALEFLAETLGDL
ncbi:hypothetical protein [Halomonas sp. BC1]|uniref:hypothetical protein n=1 Tax=Halomonas sp. BC1 TaxID=1670448 RepID=UPI0009BF80ED|nr:hypothetical protein [Halomonas sp. BC1]